MKKPLFCQFWSSKFPLFSLKTYNFSIHSSYFFFLCRYKRFSIMNWTESDGNVFTLPVTNVPSVRWSSSLISLTEYELLWTKNGNISLVQVLIMILIRLNLPNKTDLKLEVKIKLLIQACQLWRIEGFFSFAYTDTIR